MSDTKKRRITDNFCTSSSKTPTTVPPVAGTSQSSQNNDTMSDNSPESNPTVPRDKTLRNREESSRNCPLICKGSTFGI